MQTYAINAFHCLPILAKRNQLQSSNIFHFNFVSSNPKCKEVFLKFDFSGSEEGVKAYFLPYESEVHYKNDAGKLILPKKNPEANFVFTPTLTGCSVIVEEKGDHYQIYHDPRSDSKNLAEEYENIVGFIKPEDMECDKTDIDSGDDPSQSLKKDTLGFVLLMYDENSHKWQMILQRLMFAELDRVNGIQHFSLSPQHPTLLITDIPSNKWELKNKKDPKMNDAALSSSPALIDSPMQSVARI